MAIVYIDKTISELPVIDFFRDTKESILEFLRPYAAEVDVVNGDAFIIVAKDATLTLTITGN